MFFKNKNFIFLLLITTSIFILGTSSVNAAKNKVLYPWLPDKWYNLAVCESGENPPNWKHSSGTYEGAFGFYTGTWTDYKPNWIKASRAIYATPKQQYAVALILYKEYGHSPWGCFKGSQHWWVRYGPRINPT